MFCRSGRCQQYVALAVTAANVSSSLAQTWHTAQANCKNALVGTIDKPIMPDEFIRSSSQLNEESAPWRARMDSYGDWNWAPLVDDGDEWLEFDFENATFVTEIHIKGRFLADEWVTHFFVQYQGDSENWAMLEERFEGNTDRDSIKENIISPPILAKKLRLRPLNWHGRVALRVEILGCRALDVPPDLTCRRMRCLDSSSPAEGSACCQNGICGSLPTMSRLLQNQLFCAQQRYEELAEAVLQGSASKDILKAAAVVEEAKEHRRIFSRDGFLHVKSVLSSAMVQAIKINFEDIVWDPVRERRPGCLIEISDQGVFRKNQSIPLRTASQMVRKKSYRLSGLHIGAEEPKAGPWNRIFYNARIISIVSRLLGGPARLLQVLVFERGSQQSMHDDSWYLQGSDVTGGVVGVWIALDEVNLENGPVFYFPGSHQRQEWVYNPEGRSRKERMNLPGGVAADKDFQDAVYRQAQMEIQTAGFQKKIFLPSPGDIGIWHERLLHGAEPILNWKMSRLSVVIHYVLDF
eukprot:TRINITY_DN93163_c0_g1_i1.p1 TRINITY_DN93163_c0_g1~~TRINITY_DN93163_c0_g1_i1.p1  ORF type:complete len:522 (+),score=82.57 TRINITY_DN93163_c0_g1_i1:79-1644(+)